MKRIIIAAVIAACVVLLASCDKPYRCSIFNNKDYSESAGPITLSVDYHLIWKAIVSVDATETLSQPLLLAVDGYVTDTIRELPWSKDFYVNYLQLGQHLFTLTYNDGTQDYNLTSEFWTCSRFFNWDVDE